MIENKRSAAERVSPVEPSSAVVGTALLSRQGPPPSNNGGLYPPPPTLQPPTSPARFDWYACTVEEAAESVLLGLVEGLGAEVEDERGKFGYEYGAALRRGGSVVARVWWGGNGGFPHVVGTGSDTDAVVALVRARWPEQHRVTRCDVATDFDSGPGTWERLKGYAESFAAERGLKTSVAGDWLTEGSPDGRTLYVGSPKSAVFLRVYEKGKQLRKLAREEGREADVSEDLVRVELVVKPEKESRRVAARMEPEAGYGFAVWSRDFGAGLFGMDIERVTIKDVRKSDDARAVHFLTKQYGAVLAREAERLGGWTSVGLMLRDSVMRGNDDAPF